MQLATVVEARQGAEALTALMSDAGLGALPDGAAMIDENDARALHQALRRNFPLSAPGMARGAGLGTADYILAHRIPAPARHLMQAAPPWLAARMLSSAIARHAWTFAGSGTFQRLTPYVFEIADNPLIRGEHADGPICHWHAAVFERLYRVLVSDGFTCRETACCAAGAPACRFELTPV